ncbi:hypothetical protein I8751_27265 [Nostocaceae cyanobacterium CENA357]|uniref:Uncharacterized protein n=1 Tax=Atlanticothrix silvestris CENA357 TaxID=1725252 RepID=A0A8J7HIY2_9CYAN|nr:hypothetical protein [Atlanticothrix silvestris]MBH8555974.1 hypothetical protein [Atlanticothrix silvestris CENA357]
MYNHEVRLKTLLRPKIFVPVSEVETNTVRLRQETAIDCRLLEGLKVRLVSVLWSSTWYYYQSKPGVSVNLTMTLTPNKFWL